MYKNTKVFNYLTIKWFPLKIIKNRKLLNKKMIKESIIKIHLRKIKAQMLKSKLINSKMIKILNRILNLMNFLSKLLKINEISSVLRRRKIIKKIMI
jgi:hypothetical protein